MLWFEEINQEEAVWGTDKVPFDWNEEWDRPRFDEIMKARNPPPSQQQQDKIYDVLSAFREDANSWMQEVGLKTFFTGYDYQMKRDKIKNLKKYWLRAKQKFWGSEEMHYSLNNKNITGNIPFGPWIFWTEDEWFKIERNFNNFCMDQRRNRLLASQANKNSNSVQQGSTQNKENDVDDNKDRDRDRSSPNDNDLPLQPINAANPKSNAVQC